MTTGGQRTPLCIFGILVLAGAGSTAASGSFTMRVAMTAT